MTTFIPLPSLRHLFSLSPIIVAPNSWHLSPPKELLSAMCVQYFKGSGASSVPQIPVLTSPALPFHLTPLWLLPLLCHLQPRPPGSFRPAVVSFHSLKFPVTFPQHFTPLTLTVERSWIHFLISYLSMTFFYTSPISSCHTPHTVSVVLAPTSRHLHQASIVHQQSSHITIKFCHVLGSIVSLKCLYHSFSIHIPALNFFFNLWSELCLNSMIN